MFQFSRESKALFCSKFEEIWAPEVKDFVYITDETYNRDQVLRMEQLMIKVNLPEIFIFLIMSSRHWNSTFAVSPQSSLSIGSSEQFKPINRLLTSPSSYCKFRYICHFRILSFSDLTLLEYNLVKFCPSLVTTAVVLQANYVTRNAGWSDALEHYSGYTYEAGKFSDTKIIPNYREDSTL